MTFSRWTRPSLARATAMALVGLLALPLAAQTLPPAPVRIGLIAPLSGPSSDFGRPVLHGAQLAVHEINAAGGYLGRPVELVVHDDQGQPDAGLAASQAMVASGVLAAIGFCNTGVAVKSVGVFQQARVPLIVPCSAGAPVTRQFPPSGSYIFRNAPSDAIQAPFVVNDLIRRGWTRVAIFADKTPYGESGLRDVEAAMASHQLKPVHVERFDLGVKDLTAGLQRARQAGANVIFSYTVGPENATIALGRDALKWEVPQVGGWPLSFPYFIVGGGSAAEGALIDFAFFVTGEGNAVMFQLIDRLGGLTRQIFHRVGVAQPVRPLDGVIHVPLPAVGAHVAQAGRDAALCGHRMRPGREDLGHAGGAQALFGHAQRGAQACATCACQA